MSRPLKPDEEELWRWFTRTIEPLTAGARPAEPAPSEPTAAPTAPPSEVQPASAPCVPTPTLDRRTAQRLRRGVLPIDRRFDLHGHTQATAHAALLAFVAKARAEGCRHVLVVTGRGREGTGVLKRSVPRWLAEPTFHRHVTAFQEAGPRHGGEGALYLTLRRRG